MATKTRKRGAQPSSNGRDADGAVRVVEICSRVLQRGEDKKVLTEFFEQVPPGHPPLFGGHGITYLRTALLGEHKLVILTVKAVVDEEIVEDDLPE